MVWQKRGMLVAKTRVEEKIFRLTKQCVILLALMPVILSIFVVTVIEYANND